MYIDEDEIERMHDNSLELLIKHNPDNQEYLESKNNLLNEIRKRKNRKDELFNLLLDKSLTKEDYEAKEAIIKNEIKEFNDSLKKLENEQEVVLTKEALELNDRQQKIS